MSCAITLVRAACARLLTVICVSFVALELERLKASAPHDTNALVFGILDNVKRSFTSARSDAGLKNVRFHDLRHTAATRLVGAHIPLSEVGRVLGHSQANTTYGYVNSNVETAKRAAAALDAFNAETLHTDTAPELVH
jgi:integrase